MSELSERLNKVIKRVEEMENTPSELTKDSLLAELRNFYDVAKNVDTTGISEPVSVQASESTEVEDKQEESEPEPQPSPVAEMKTVEEKTEAEPEKSTTSPVAEIKEEPKKEPVEEPVAEENEPAVSDPVAEKKPFIGNDEKAAKSSDDKILAGQLSKKPLEDLRTGIPLNEKFGIIRSLFKGNASDYGDAVLKLNNAVSPSEMQHYLDLLKQRFGWDLESEAYQSFSVYVERKMLTLQTSDANTDQ